MYSVRRVLNLAEVGPVEQLLEAHHLRASGLGLVYGLFVAVDHRRLVAGPLGLQQCRTYGPGHGASSLLEVMRPPTSPGGTSTPRIVMSRAYRDKASRVLDNESCPGQTRAAAAQISDRPPRGIAGMVSLATVSDAWQGLAVVGSIRTQRAWPLMARSLVGQRLPRALVGARLRRLAFAPICRTGSSSARSAALWNYQLRGRGVRERRATSVQVQNGVSSTSRVPNTLAP